MALTFNQAECWQAIIVPVSWNENTNEWNVLLGKDSANGQWSFFGETAHGKENAQKFATDALFVQTNNIIELDPNYLKGKPWFKRPNGDIVHFVPTEYVSAKFLYKKMKEKGKFANNIKNDYAWLPIDKIIGKFSITEQVRGKQRDYRFSRETQDLLDLWDLAVQQLGGDTKKQIKASKDSWKGLGNAIYFYESSKPYYEFTNFDTDSVIDAQGHEWPTSENYFQAQKFVDNPQLYNQMKRLTTPRQAFDFARQHKNEYDQNAWNKRSVAVMLDAVRRKFNENMRLKHLLFNTGDKILVEDAGANDAFWGAGAQGEGTNLLGQVLMRVRAELLGLANEDDDFIWYKNYKDYRNQENGNIVRFKKEAPTTKKPIRVQPKKGMNEALIINLKQLVTKLERLQDMLP